MNMDMSLDPAVVDPSRSAAARTASLAAGVDGALADEAAVDRAPGDGALVGEDGAIVLMRIMGLIIMAIAVEFLIAGLTPIVREMLQITPTG